MTAKSILTEIESATLWAKAHGFAPITRPCKNCGKEFTTTIKYQDKHFVGLHAPIHEPCGERYQLKTLISSNLAKRVKVRNFFRDFFE